MKIIKLIGRVLCSHIKCSFLLNWNDEKLINRPLMFNIIKIITFELNEIVELLWL